MSNESTIHIKNIKVLMTEMYKFLNDLSPPTMNDIYGNTYIKIGTIQRRLAWPLRKDDT